MSNYESETSGRYYDRATADRLTTQAAVEMLTPQPKPPLGEPPFLVAVNDRLDRLGKLIDEGRSMAATLRERTMGPWPDEAGKPASGGDLSEFGQVLGRLDHLIALAETSANHVGALAARI